MRVMPLKQEVSNNSFVLLSPFLQEDNQIFCHCTGGMNAITKDNYEDNIKLILRCHGYEPRTFEDFHTCYDCKKVFGFDYEDVYKSCDTIDGQYTEFDAIRCPHCLIENRW